MTVMTVIFENLWDHYILWSVIVSIIAFGWLFHHSFWFVSEEGKEVPNVDGLKVGVFPVHNDAMSLEDAHWRLSAYCAKAAGREDRGSIAGGRPADIRGLGPTGCDVDLTLPRRGRGTRAPWLRLR